MQSAMLFSAMRQNAGRKYIDRNRNSDILTHANVTGGVAGRMCGPLSGGSVMYASSIGWRVQRHASLEINLHCLIPCTCNTKGGNYKG